MLAVVCFGTVFKKWNASECEILYIIDNETFSSVDYDWTKGQVKK
jgi:hypothetical protein